MALRRYNAEAPIRVPLVDRVSLIVTLRWLQWFQAVGERLQADAVTDEPYNPPSIASGALHNVAVPFAGARPRDLVKGVSFEPMTEGAVPITGMQLFGTVNQPGSVFVTFWNVSGGAIDLDAGTIRVELERVA